MVVVGCGVTVVEVEVVSVEESDEEVPVDKMDDDPDAVVGTSEEVPEVGSEAVDENNDEDSPEDTTVMEVAADDSTMRPLYLCRERRLAAEAPGTVHRSARKGA